MNDKEMLEKAYMAGFSKAAVISVDELVYVPEYRKYCEENLCGNFNRLPACPPACGTVEELHEKMLQYKNCLVLQAELIPVKKEMSEYLEGKRKHNKLRA